MVGTESAHIKFNTKLGCVISMAGSKVVLINCREHKYHPADFSGCKRKALELGNKSDAQK